MEFFAVLGAIAQIEVDEVLIGHAQFFGQFLKVGDRCLVQPDGNELLQGLDIGILFILHFVEIVMFTHDTNSNAFSNETPGLHFFSLFFASSHSKGQ
jgi:hypothetical protein